MRTPWIAVVAAAFIAGAGTIMLADPGTTEPRVLVTPAAASSAAHTNHTTINGQKIKGVKAADIAAESLPDEPLDSYTRAVLAGQLAEARTTAERYATVADAKADGYILAGGFAPGSGAHYVLTTGRGFVSGTSMDVAHPGSLIYAGTNDDSKIVGLMYLGGGADAPEGFAGPNDHWHRHSAVCVRYGPNGIEVPFPADADVTREMCTKEHGQYMTITTWMVHAWVVPSWESPLGVFSHDNPNIRCADGTYETDTAGFCDGV
jgi:hypothetical protein